jgi:hypothetical protein
VLFDSVPVNDPFGGWVYWMRSWFPRTRQRMEKAFQEGSSPCHSELDEQCRHGRLVHSGSKLTVKLNRCMFRCMRTNAFWAISSASLRFWSTL